MLKFLNGFQNANSDEDSEASDDDARSTVSLDSTTFYQRTLDLEDENSQLKKQAITAQNDFAQLKAQLEALQLAAAKTAREREAEVKERREAEEKLLAEKAADTQKIETALRQAAEERLARERADNLIDEKTRQLENFMQTRHAEVQRLEAEKNAAENTTRLTQAELTKYRDIFEQPANIIAARVNNDISALAPLQKAHNTYMAVAALLDQNARRQVITRRR